MQKYVIEKFLSKHSIKVDCAKSQANDNKAMIMKGCFMKEKDFSRNNHGFI